VHSILSIIVFSYVQASMASNMTNSDLDESLVAMEINFTFVGQTRTWHVGKYLNLVSSPPTPKDSKEEQRKQKQRENTAKVQKCLHQRRS
jgi:hypothetical protein